MDDFPAMDFSDIDPRLMGSGTCAWADETNDTNSIAMPYQATSHNQSVAANANFAGNSDDAFRRAGYDSAAGQDNVDRHYGFKTSHDASTTSINKANSASFSSLAPGYTAMPAEPSYYRVSTPTHLPEIPDICLIGRTSDSLSPPPIMKMSSAREVLPVQVPQTRYESYIKSEAEAGGLFKQYLAQRDTDEGSLAGFPRDSVGQRRLVRQAVDAMMQLEGSREAAEAEKAEGGAKRRLTAYNRVVEHFWSDLELELMGWRLLTACKDAQLGGCQVAGWSTDRRMPNRCEAFDTFADRWNEVLSHLRVSKRTVKALFDTPFVARLAWDVAGEGKRIEANQKGNAKKGRILRERARDEGFGN
ncbi:hypothetical protein DL771_006135 [Monosporascus sp. 5C6A]|nr:hypothetical protein DL771_006135 [Monosporascus sp. 5C6A]